MKTLLLLAVLPFFIPTEFVEQIKVDVHFTVAESNCIEYVCAVISLNKEFPLKPSDAGELLRIGNFETKIDPDVEKRNPNQQGFKFKDEIRVEN